MSKGLREEEEPIGIREELEALLKIQDQDLEIRELRVGIERLRSRREELERKIEREKKVLEGKREELGEMHRDSRKKNDEVDSLDYQIRNYQKQLDEGIMSFKEMEVLKGKIEQLREKMEELEDKALGLMMEIEAKEEELAKQESSFERWREKIELEIQKLEKEIGGKSAGVQESERRREQLESGVGHHLLAQYERLLQDYEYEEPIATVEGGSCSGCKMSLSRNTLEKIREGMELVTCENCHRILYVR